MACCPRRCVSLTTSAGPWLVLPLLSLLLSACTPERDTNPTQDAEAFTAVKEDAVWPHPDIFRACYSPTEGSREEGCMIDALYRAKADDAVINAVEQLSVDGDPGYVSHYRRIGDIGILTLTHPFRANTNDETVLAGTDGSLTFVDDTPLSHHDEQSRAYSALLDEFPGLMPFPPAHLNRVERGVDGSVRLRFDTPMSYCHACQPNAWLSLLYTFDGRGHFNGEHLIDVQRTGVD